eukprot:6871301-Prymnesium_polylepis.1
MMFAKVVAFIALILQKVDGQLSITTGMNEYEDSAGQVTISLLDANGNSKGVGSLRGFARGQHRYWTPPNGAQWAAGDTLRFAWGDSDSWKITGLSLSGFTLEGQTTPFWMDRDGAACANCSEPITCSCVPLENHWFDQPHDRGCYDQPQCYDVGAACGTRMAWTVRARINGVDLLNAPPPSRPLPQPC